MPPTPPPQPHTTEVPFMPDMPSTVVAELSFDDIVEIVLRSVADLNEERPADDQIPLGVDTPLFGPDALLDSLGLVSVIADVEMGVSDELGRPIALGLEREQLRCRVD